MRLSSKLLRLLCRDPSAEDYPKKGIHYEMPKALDRLRAVFPNITEEIVGKSVVDFGCAFGYQVVALALAGARQVWGIEIDENGILETRKKASQYGVSDKIRVERQLAANLQADIIISQNSFEHFLNAEEILSQMAQALAPGGRIYITFAPPWYAPWGAHMAYFCRVPWVHLLFSERTVMEVRSLFRSDGAKSYHAAGLAQMSVAKFKRIVRRSGLKILSSRYECIRGIAALRYLPYVQEIFINRVSCVLTR